MGTGPGTYIGSITISDLGVATFTAPIPEPSTYGLLGLGGVGFLGASRFRKVTV